MFAAKKTVEPHFGHPVHVQILKPPTWLPPLGRHQNSHRIDVVQCVAVSPAGDRVAAGDVTGRILIWHGVGPAVAAAADASSDEQQQQSQQQGQQDDAATAAPQPVLTTMHWHAHAVRALAFSLDSQRLLSGGDEAVLVSIFNLNLVSTRRTQAPFVGMKPSRWARQYVPAVVP